MQLSLDEWRTVVKRDARWQRVWDGAKLCETLPAQPAQPAQGANK